MKCTLSSDINKCSHYNKETLECNYDKQCIFQINTNEKSTEKYVREERWYEKYYKKKDK